MASSEVDQKFLGKLAKAIEPDNPFLSSMLFKILGLSVNLSQQLVMARQQRRRDQPVSPQTLKMYLHIIWLSREGVIMLEQYVLPVVGQYVELKVLAYKLRASFYHIFVLCYNQPPLSTMGLSTFDLSGSSSSTTGTLPVHTDKGKSVARDDDPISSHSSLQPTHALEGGPVNLSPPPGLGFGLQPHPAAFLLPPKDYLPMADNYFQHALGLADTLLWGSHSLRLSVKTEYSAFLYECMHEYDRSRRLAKDTIAEVYEASEGIDNDMFADACELVTVLGKMMRRGLHSNNSTNPSSTSRPRGNSSATTASASTTAIAPRPPRPQQPHILSKQPTSAPPRTMPPPIPVNTATPVHTRHVNDRPGFI